MRATLRALALSLALSAVSGIEEVRSCVLDCLTTVPTGWEGMNEGPMRCHWCRCDEGHLECKDAEPGCEPTTCAMRQDCTLACGTTVHNGWVGMNEGPESCSQCQCYAGELSCQASDTRLCQPSPCPGQEGHCTLSCGTAVPNGWSGMNEGPDICHGCKCDNSALTCSVAPIDPTCEPSMCDTMQQHCMLECGTFVPHGWVGMNEGPHKCHKCRCNNGGLVCNPVPVSDCKAGTCESKAPEYRTETPEHVQTSTPVHVQTQTPEYVQTSTPVHVQTQTPEYVQTKTPEYIRTSTPTHNETDEPETYAPEYETETPETSEPHVETAMPTYAPEYDTHAPTDAPRTRAPYPETHPPTDAPKTRAPRTRPPPTYAPPTKAPETYPPRTRAPPTKAPETNAPRTRPPPTEAPPTRPPRTRAPPTEAPPTRPPRTYAPRTEAPETRPPRTYAPDTEAPDTRAPPTKAPDTEAPPTRPPQTYAPRTEAPPTRPPRTYAPDTEAPDTRAPPTKAPATDAPPTRPPRTYAPDTEAPATRAPPTKAPATEAPPTRPPRTYAPDTDAPPTRPPLTKAPETEAPPTRPPRTYAPDTQVPTHAPPTDAPPTRPPPTKAPETEAPPTRPPRTRAPPTEAPPTRPPRTYAPRTEAPETRPPRTYAPDTEAPDTRVPPTKAPETDAPPTRPPRTYAPRTEAPETRPPHTYTPYTEGPTPAPPTHAPRTAAPEQKRCMLECGTVVPHGWSGMNEGPEICHMCKCVDGNLICTAAPIPGCEPSVCQGERCVLECGTPVPHGWVGMNEGPLQCHRCKCHDGALTCDPSPVLADCQPGYCPHTEAPDTRVPRTKAPETPAPLTEAPSYARCVLACGTVVAHGWYGMNEGPEICYRCKCDDGAVICSAAPEPGCEPSVCQGERCVLECGTPVPHGWVGMNEGPLRCHRCKCDNGALTCAPATVTTAACQPGYCETEAPKDTPAPMTEAPSYARCVLECGTVVTHGWVGMNEGPEICHRCKCDDGNLVCAVIPIPGCEPAVCPMPKKCTLECGTVVPHGWNGMNEGPEICHRCKCDDGNLVCAVIPIPGCEPAMCPMPKKCTLECGTVVPHGWGGMNEGPEICHRCKCDDGNLVCAVIPIPGCEPAVCPMPKKCKLECGTVVPHGWGGMNEGPERCHMCKCDDGALVCNPMARPGCEPAPCDPAPKTCTLECNTVVPHGWLGMNEGPQRCHRCKCDDGNLICNILPMPGCQPGACIPPVDTTCKLECGTLVPHGWSGMNEGPQGCNRCRCHGGFLACNFLPRPGCQAGPCDPLQATCRLECGSLVPHGWGGMNEGPQRCHRCRCDHGNLVCNAAAFPGCAPAPCDGDRLDCTLECGTVVPHGWGGVNEGPERCHPCRCDNGALRCSPVSIPDCAPAPCEPLEACTLECGTVVPHGWGGANEGPESCHRCRCDNGALICTVLPDCEPSVCKHTPCTLECGTTVPHGWSGMNEGPESCYFCKCDHGAVTCSPSPVESSCVPSTCPGRNCTLACGTVVHSGWNGMNEGPESCHNCRCDAASGLTCDPTPIANCEPSACETHKECSLECGDVVPHGWTGMNDGPQSCHTCKCDDGMIICDSTPNPDCVPSICNPDDACLLECGTLVPHGWAGMNEGPNLCTPCRCSNSSLVCLQMQVPGCTPSVCHYDNCTLECGTSVMHGWAGMNEGSESCHECKCHDGALTCDPLPTCPSCQPSVCPSHEPCTLECGTAVPHGWIGMNEGPERCHPCRCDGGALHCSTLSNSACAPQPCEPQEKECTLDCGTVVPHGWVGMNEGPEICHRCKCDNGALTCDPNSIDTACQPSVCQTCTLECGTVVPHGWNGRDEGPQRCHPCRCYSGSLICSPPMPNCAAAPCEAAHEHCTLECGTSVPHGWGGTNEGPERCHRCRCNRGHLICDPQPISSTCRPGMCQPQTNRCTLACGGLVPHGWHGMNQGPEICHRCKCDDGDLFCSPHSAPGCEPETCRGTDNPEQCTLECGAMVPHDWSGMNEGPESCHRCLCDKGALVCSPRTQSGCVPSTCAGGGDTDDHCKLECGTSVPEGWSGMNEGPERCHQCRCWHGQLHCQVQDQLGCVPSLCNIFRRDIPTIPTQNNP